MATSFDECLTKGGLHKISPDMELAREALKEAELNFSEAMSAFKRKVWKWATNHAYYTMFECARACLFTKGYKEFHSHRCLLAGFKELFVKTGELSSKFYDYLNTVKEKREEAVYAAAYSESIAKLAIEAAEEFLEQAGKFLDSKA